MLPSFINKDNLPHKPGVYIFKDENGEVLYVGKAIDLNSRVSSYFNSRGVGVKIAHLVEKIRSLEMIIVESEIEALVLEANLIKKYLPLYNIRLTDDKDYLYIKVTDEVYPQIVTARKQELNTAKKYFGPFPSGRTVKTTLKRLRRVFPWCARPPKAELRVQSDEFRVKRYRPCFYYHLGLCPGACVGKCSKEEYSKIIRGFSKFMEGKSEELKEELAAEMAEASKDLDFEKAQRLKKTLEGLFYLTQPNRTTLYLSNPNFLEEERESTLIELQKSLNLKDLPSRIECYDISNISGKEATGSMVVLTNGEIDKSQYRKFKIHISGKPNDVGMHREMFKRRLKHDEWERPDLILIDGGRAQVRVYKEEMEILGWKMPVLGLAKRLEWLYPSEGEIIKLSKSSLSLRLLQKIRDEAHRFAITYHKKLRKKAFLG